MRNWIKSIILECLNEINKGRPFILSNRPPSPHDLHEKGTWWKCRNDIYVAKNVTVEWEKQ